MAIYDMGQNSWHAEDCGGYPFCNGCGHVVDGFWYPGPPREDVPGRLEYLRGEIRAGRIPHDRHSLDGRGWQRAAATACAVRGHGPAAHGHSPGFAGDVRYLRLKRWTCQSTRQYHQSTETHWRAVDMSDTLETKYYRTPEGTRYRVRIVLDDFAPELFGEAHNADGEYVGYIVEQQQTWVKVGSGAVLGGEDIMTTWEHTDSCWGYDDQEYALKEAVSTLPEGAEEETD